MYLYILINLCIYILIYLYITSTWTHTHTLARAPHISSSLNLIVLPIVRREWNARAFTVGSRRTQRAASMPLAGRSVVTSEARAACERAHSSNATMHHSTASQSRAASSASASTSKNVRVRSIATRPLQSGTVTGTDGDLASQRCSRDDGWNVLRIGASLVARSGPFVCFDCCPPREN